MKRSRLLVFGFDAGHPPWMEQWALEGTLPFVRQIMERGWWARTRGTELISEHGLWTVLLSGESRGRLAYYYFRQLRPGSYDLVEVTGLDVKATFVWQRLSAGRKVAVVDVPEVLPSPGVAGVQVANWAPHRGWKSRHPAHQLVSEPEGLARELARRFGPRDEIIERVGTNAAQERHMLRRMLRRIQRKGDLCEGLLSRENYDLVVVVFTEPHTAGHVFWKYREGTADGELATAIKQIYKAVDAELGRLLGVVGSDVNVVVLSSVGLEDHFPTGGLVKSLCCRLGYQVPAAQDSWSWHPMAMVRRVVPERWRCWASRILPRDTRERLLADQFRRETDWTRTKAFALPGFFNGMIRVNLRGREPQGIVEPGCEYAELLDRLEADFRALVDPVEGEPVVGAVYRPGKLFGEDPPQTWPDLWIVWRPSTRFWDRVVHPQMDLCQARPEFFRDTDHSQEGWIAMAGPDVQERGARTACDVLAVAPTLLKMLGEPIPAGLATPLNEI